MQTEIKRWGNSAAIRIPTKLLAAAHMEVDSQISMKAEEGKIIVEIIKRNPEKRLNLPFSEAQLTKGLNADKAHAEDLAILNNKELGD